jgi:hypothetical protein
MANERARTLRKNLTEAEQRLWQKLKQRQIAGVKFRRQQPIGPFIVDFVCFEHRVIVEVDGGQHGEQFPTTGSVLSGWRNRVIGYCDSGTTKFWHTRTQWRKQF